MKALNQLNKTPLESDEDSRKPGKPVKEYSFAETWAFISQGKGDLRGIYSQNPVPLPKLAKPVRTLTPSVLCKKLFCPAFVPKPYSNEPLEKRQEYDVLARMSVVKTILRMTKLGYRFAGSEVASGNFSGRVDLVFQRPNEPETKVEVKSSKHLRPWDIVQGILYHEPHSKIGIASINDYLEPEEWLIESVKSAATDLDEFMQEFPEEAAKIKLPHAKLCIKCADVKCPFKKPN
jgi:hypothetical protein